MFSYTRSAIISASRIKTWRRSKPAWNRSRSCKPMVAIQKRNWSTTAKCANIRLKETRDDRHVFRSRLMPNVREEYVILVDRMIELAQTMPGYISHKGFFADDGERGDRSRV